MIGTPGKTSALALALLLALYTAPAVGFDAAALPEQQTDAASFAPAVPGVAVGAANLAERTHCPQADPAQSALLPDAIRPLAAGGYGRFAACEGPRPVLACLAGTIPIRAPPGLPL